MASTYTVLNLITRSLRLLNVLNAGDPPTADQEQDALEALNAMVDAWKIERLMIYQQAREVFSSTANQGSYAIGPNADPVLGWVAQRPSYIDAAALIYSAGGSVFETPIQIFTPKEWQNLSAKGLGGTSATGLYYDYGFSGADSSAAGSGSGTIYVYPVPTNVQSVALYLPQAVSEFTSVNQTLALPPGYRRALVYNLCVEAGPEFHAAVTPLIAGIADESKEIVKRANVHLSALSCDPALLHQRRGGFNIYTGEGR